MQQVKMDHPLHAFGYRLPPFWLWRKSQRCYAIVMAIKDIWLIATGRVTLHRAWQAGHDHGHLMEVERQMRGGR